LIDARIAARALAVGLMGTCTAPALGGPIQDNSFLIEEAYNQEPGVVQHISTFVSPFGSDAWSYAFTQEWPVRGQQQQLSFTFLYLQPEDAPGTGDGLGDLALHWRYQLVGDGEAPVAVAPRLSLVLPVGDEREGRGDGAAGFEVNLPLSVALGERFVTHVNAGASQVPRARDAQGNRADIAVWRFGQSLVWLARPRLNAVAELVFATGETVSGADATERFDELFFNPGVRWSHDLAGGLQIVPGIAVPIGLGPSSGEQSIFFYLSFEHPFTAAARAAQRAQRRRRPTRRLRPGPGKPMNVSYSSSVRLSMRARSCQRSSQA
jgi:hypothetical protein